MVLGIIRMIAPSNIFSTDPGKIFDFSGKRTADIFNKVVAKRANELEEMAFVEEGAQRRQQQLQMDEQEDLFRQQSDDNFLSDMLKQPVLSQDESPQLPEDEQSDYDLPVAQGGPTGDLSVKLSNYGYDSDSSPDYKSNVLKIGNRNNKLEDGVSAALTASLAKRLGIKPGQEFEAVAKNGTIYKRRYDDTVPTTYKGKPLPETVDLYQRKGSNTFGGTIVDIRPL